MPTGPKKPIIFISYAHADEPEKPAEGEVKWLSFVTGYLRPAIKHGAVDIWIDRLMPGGADWEREIAAKLSACDIFILLVSRHSLSSDYVVDREIKIIRERQAKGENVHFYPLVLTPTPNVALKTVADKNLRPRDGKPLSDFSINERYRHMSDAADEISEMAQEARAQRSSFLPDPSSFLDSPPAPMAGSVQVTGQDSLEAWLEGQRREVAVAIAARVALRLLPLAVEGKYDRTNLHQLAHLTSALFRATALARAAAKYPARANELRAAYAAAADAASAAATHSGNAYAYGAADAVEAATAADETATRIAAASSVARASAPYAFAAAEKWEEVRADVAALRTCSVNTLADLPLWSTSAPQFVTEAWDHLKAGLPKGQEWQIWIDWYEERLRGGSRSEDHELVFASVPQEEWGRGPAAANAWIKAHLPKAREAARPPELPDPLPNLEAPFAFGWNANVHVAIVAGAQNLPYYPNFKSEEDHRHTLEACRVGGERLLKALRGGRYNARPEYGEALEYYLNDLPKTAGAGNILLANSQARILHAMFVADADALPVGFASGLKDLIANQFALSGFYDLVQRHNEAVNTANWTEPFPIDAARDFFGVVDENTPRFFEREVGEGLRLVEESGQPLAPAAPEAGPSAAIEPPPLPPGTPDAARSHERQMATAANALYEAFLKGRNLPVDKESWREAAEKLGTNVRPILDFLRALDQPKA